jgi:hypothetical protein
MFTRLGSHFWFTGSSIFFASLFTMPFGAVDHCCFALDVKVVASVAAMASETAVRGITSV